MMYRAVGIMILTFALPAWTQTQNRRAPIPLPMQPDEFAANRPMNLPTSFGGSEYRIGSDDLIEVTVFEVPELGSTGRVSGSGVVSFPLIGIVNALGKTTQELEEIVREALKEKYLKDPHVTVFVREYASQPVSVVGSVKLPGIYQIKGQKYLLDMLAMAQGLDATAGQTIQIVRRSQDSSEQPRTIIVSTEDLFQNGKAELNIPVQAGDVINVLQAGSIFVVGEVSRPGEFVLRQGRNVSAAQAVALGGGFTREAKRKGCVIIRVHADGTKEEIPVNVEKVLDGSTTDVALLPNDILFVPANKVKSGALRALDTTIATISGRIMYRY